MMADFIFICAVVYATAMVCRAFVFYMDSAWAYAAVAIIVFVILCFYSSCSLTSGAFYDTPPTTEKRQ